MASTLKIINVSAIIKTKLRPFKGQVLVLLPFTCFIEKFDQLLMRDGLSPACAVWTIVDTGAT